MSSATVDSMLDALSANQLDLQSLKDRGRRLVEIAAKTSKKAAQDVLAQQEAIADMMRRVRFEGLDVANAKRNISYRKRQITAIFERVKNKGARVLAKEYNEVASNFLTALWLIAKGVIL